MAIMARWRIPPLNLKGYSSTLSSGLGIPTRRSISTAKSRACCCETSRCSMTASTIWEPMVCTGLNDTIGSWKIMVISPPLMSLMAALSGSRKAKSIGVASCEPAS